MSSLPNIDTRTGDQIVEQGKTLAREYTPDWQPRSGDRGLAMLALFGRLMEVVINRLNRVPEKNFLAFLDTAGISLLPPKAARAPVRFVAVEGAPDDGIAPAGTQVATAPPSGQEPAIFETEKSLVVHRSQLLHIVTHDPVHDTCDDRADVVAANNGNTDCAFTPLVGATQIPHRMYLAQDTLLRINHPTRLTLIFKLDRMSPTFTNLFQNGLSWTVPSSGADITPPADQVTVDQDAKTITVVLQSPSTAIDAVPVDGTPGRWVAAETKYALSGDEADLNIQSIRLLSSATDIQPVLAFFNTTVLDTRREYFPFGQRPKIFDTFFIGIPEAFSKTGSRITLQPSYQKGKAGAQGVELTFEFWTATAWKPLGMMNHTGSVAGSVNTDYNFKDTTNAFTVDEAVNINIQFDCPAMAMTEVNGKKNYWIRVRITDGDYGEDAKMTLINATPPPTLDKWRYDGPSFEPPVITSLTASYHYENEQTLTACKTENNFDFTPVDPVDTFQPFVGPGENQPACCFGFDRAFSQKPVNLFIAVAESAFTAPPVVVWEYWNGSEWKHLGAQDGTMNFTESGAVAFLGPGDMGIMKRFGIPMTLYWIRARLEAGDPRQIQLLGAYLNTTWTRNCTTIRNEQLGSSTETPNAEFTLSRSPVLEGLKIEVREPDQPGEEELSMLRGEEGEDVLLPADPDKTTSRQYWVRWHRVDDFRSSARTSRHYAIDWLTGKIRFGDGKKGMIPPAGRDNIRAAWYQSGGGARATAARNTMTVLKRSIPFVEKAFNVDAAGGGSDAETAAAVMVRGPQAIKHRDRAVTLEDYEWLAREASFQVARAKCLGARTKDDAGLVRLIIVPLSDALQPSPSQGLIRQVKDFLNTRVRRIGTANLSVSGPQYIDVAVQATVVPEKIEAADQVRRQVDQSLTDFFHPLFGGPDQAGWEFGRDVYVSEVCQVIENTPGVHHAENVTLSSAVSGLSGVFQITIPDNALVTSGEHAVGVSISAETLAGGTADTVAVSAATRYLGNRHSRELHDLSRTKPQCQIDRIRPDHRVLFHTVAEARLQGYDACGWCFGPEASTR